MHKTDHEPDEEADPRFERQAKHQDEAKDHAENWKHWNERHTKRARTIRVGRAQAR